MGRASLLAVGVSSLLVAVTFAIPAEDGPRILATVPVSGSERVSVRLSSVVVVFDREMDRESHSLVGAEGGEVPPVDPDVTWLNPRTVRIPLGALAAGRSYALGLNSERHRGFRAVGGAPLAPAVIRFSTAGPGESARPVVVVTEPELGATDVDPVLSEILVTFSEDVRKGGMSLVRLSGAEVLGYVR